MSVDISSLPDIDFVDVEIETLLADMVNDYEVAYYEQNGETKTLAQGDPIRIWIYSQALKLYQAYQLINYSAKQNLVKYAESSFLDNLVARVGITRLEAEPAICTVRFSLTDVQLSAVNIPEGTRVSTTDNVFFSTTSYAEIAVGETYVDVECECTENGTAGNGYIAGQISTLVDLIAYIASVENLDTSQGGAEEEDDDSLRERMVLVPESFSVAGPSGAYEYFAKQYSSQVSDVKVTSSTAGEVDIRIILEDGEIPEQTILDDLFEYLSDSTRRPLTDSVIVQAPTTIGYDLEVTYYINSSDESLLTSLQSDIENSVSEYITWQKSKIGRDINPSKLYSSMITAGAKRIELTSPSYQSLEETDLAICDNISIIYGGVEGD